MVKEITTEKELINLTNTSAYTITGAGGDLNEWIKGYTKILNDNNVGTPKEWYTFNGELMNTTYKLKRDNYNPTLTFLSFSLDGLDVGKLAMIKLKLGDRWLDDIVDNNLRREHEQD
jgi:hypothetical protein